MLPAVSWDGSQVAFIMANPGTIRVASLRGGPPLTLVDSGFQSQPAGGPGDSCTTSVTTRWSGACPAAGGRQRTS